jgi:hypothetical protein
MIVIILIYIYIIITTYSVGSEFNKNNKFDYDTYMMAYLPVIALLLGLLPIIACELFNIYSF